MQRNKLLVLASLNLLLAGQVLADDYVPTFGDLSTLQAQQMFYELKAKRDKSKQEAAGYEVSSTASSAAPVTGAGNPVPRLSGVVGNDLNLYGTFVYSSGSKVEGRAGDILPGGFRISSVGVGKASLIKDGKTIQLMQQSQGVDAPVQPVQMGPGMPTSFGQPIAPVMR